MKYIDHIADKSFLTIDDIIDASKKCVPPAYKNSPWNYPGLVHGTACLTTDEQLCCYMAAYGEMHKGKLNKIISDFPLNAINDNFEIIDWGCGQGIATVCFISALRGTGVENRLQKVSLIEPSGVALSRAKLNVEHCVSVETYIETLQCYLPDTNHNPEAIGGLHIEEPICIHLFSNILDIAAIDLKELALMISCSGFRHYFLCVGPNNVGNTRIEQFCRYFNVENSNIFSDFRAPQYRQMENGKWYSCITKGFQILREEGKPFLVPLSYYPPKQFFAAYRLDALEQLAQPKDTNKDVWLKRAAFEVLAPFDIGASIYDDIHPIWAVISNIVTRGLPTKCSPFIEERLNEEFDFSQKGLIYGSMRYSLANIDKFLSNETMLRLIPIAIARVQKVLIEAVLTGHISIEQSKWDILVKEYDVPCAALAIADLKRTFTHLTSLSREYNQMKFPEVNLHIISSNYPNCGLHLDANVYSKSNQVNKETPFDIVIDIAVNEYIDAANVQFSEFKAKNDCYFNVRSSRIIYSTRDIYTTDTIIYRPVTVLNNSGVHDVIKEQEAHLTYFLQLLFRKEEFRPGQLPILNRALQGKGVIGLLPTGGGKSLTYQLAAMLQPGLTVVIDPLKSLMEDQYDGLMATGIDCCTFINSELNAEEKARNESKMESSQVLFTFMSPERLCIYEFRERLENMHELNVYFSYGVIDEVHCVSEWGQDFRFSYLHLGRNLYNYVRGKNKPISLFGLTATASFDVLSDVERELTGNGAFMLDPDAVVRYENSNRLELQYKVEKVEIDYQQETRYRPTADLAQYPFPVNIGKSYDAYNQKSTFLRDYIKQVPTYIRELQTEESLSTIVSRFQDRENLEGIDSRQLNVDMPDDYYNLRKDYQQAGIVFCPHVNSTGLSVNVNSQNLREICEVGTFSGSSDGIGMNNDSMANMKKFRDNQLPIMVATKAFGMGIDKPNVRYTINMNYSTSLESFVQEAGRAGRDRKMALSVILMSDYRLARISRRHPYNGSNMDAMRGFWFKEQDLRTIINSLHLNIDERFIEYCNPVSDMVRFKCNTDNVKDDGTRKSWSCQNGCSKYRDCQLRLIDHNLRWEWMYIKDMNEYIRQQGLRIERECIEYQSADHRTVMYFFDNNFKGEFVEKQKMHELMSLNEISYFYGNDKKDKPNERKTSKGFLPIVLGAKTDTEIVSIISYEEDSYADVAKAIYRMCVIGLVDDFTQDYITKSFRILSTRKKNGSYYERLKEFLMRYYAEERAENEVEKASVRRGRNEIEKCLGYLTEFIYDKVASKRRRAIDDMRNFCMIGIDQSKDWKEVNEDLKDEIYYYFNSKFAREGYKTDAGEPFSLLDDTDRARISSFDLVYKYMRVIDNDVMGVSGSPKDNIKHLHGAVRLIRRSETDLNPALCLLNVFCLLVMKAGSNKNLMEDLKNSYREGYKGFRDQCLDISEFYDNIKRFKKELNKNSRNIVTQEDLALLDELSAETELSIHAEWLDTFTKQYNN